MRSCRRVCETLNMRRTCLTLTLRLPHFIRAFSESWVNAQPVNVADVAEIANAICCIMLNHIFIVYVLLSQYYPNKFITDHDQVTNAELIRHKSLFYQIKHTLEPNMLEQSFCHSE
jgi:hypothetical protein